MRTSNISNSLLLLIVAGLCYCATSCRQKAYEPEGLRKLSHEEIKERVAQGIAPNPDVVVKNEQGDIIPSDSLGRIRNIEEWTTDVYVNDEGLDIELILRKATPADIALRDEVNSMQRNAAPDVPYKEINCDSAQVLLERALVTDQATRNAEGAYDPEQDFENLTTVVNIIEQCGMPTRDEVGSNGMRAVWLVIQHGSHKYRKKYIDQLEEAARQGDLRMSSVAMMKDRILMDDNLPQVYGTQVVRSGPDEPWRLYELADPEYVNKRRLEAGFGPIEEYLARWDIVFDVPQKE